MEQLQHGTDVLFLLAGAVMVLAMHSGFAFLELGTVRAKNQVNALVKILADFSASTLAYFFVGYGIAYGIDFFASASQLTERNGYDLVKFFFLLTFAAAIPAIVSGGIAERARFYPQLLATVLIVAVVYPLFEGIVWNDRFGVQAWITQTFGVKFHDFAGSVVVARHRRLDRPRRGAAARPAARPLQEGRGDDRAPAVEHSVPRHRGLGADRRLVRLQRHVRPEDRRHQRPGRRQLAHGDGRRHPGRAGRRPERPGFRAQRPARGVGGGLRRLRSDAPGRALVTGAVAGALFV